MKLRGWAIDGFGIFHDHVVRDLPNGLTVIHGPNEAGKTTLLAFIRGVLFGFPDGRSAEPRYPPLIGGRHGGRLMLSGPGGDYVVDRAPGAARRAVRVILPGGREGTEDDLRTVIGPVDRHLYRSVFAFSLVELQEFATLTAQGLRDRLFSVGITGAGVSAHTAVAELDDRATDLMRLFRDLTDQLDDTQSNLAKAQGAAERYPALVLREETARQAREQMSAALSQLEREARRLRMLVRVWPPFQRKREAERHLGALESIEAFPADPEMRLAQVTERIERRRDSLGEAQRELVADEAERGAIVLDDRLAAAAPEVLALREQLTLYHDHREKLSRAVVERQQAELVLAQRLGDLGPGWDEAGIQEFDRSIPRQEQVRSFEARLDQAREAARAAASRLEAAESRRQDLVGDVARLEQQPVAPEPMARDEIEAREGLLQSVRADLTTVHEQEIRIEHDAALATDRAHLLRVLTDGGPWSPRKVAIAATSVVVLLALALRTSDSDLLLPALGLGAAVVVAAVVFQVRISRRHKHRIGEAAQGLRDIEQGVADTRRSIEGLRARIGRQGTVLNLTSTSDWSAVEQVSRALRDEVMDRERWDQRQAALAQAREKCARADEDMERHQTAAAATAKAIGVAQTEWQGWKSAMSLPEELSPPACLEFFRTIEAARGAVNDASRARADEASLRHEIAGWQLRAGQALGSKELDGELLPAQVIALATRCEQDGAERAKAARLDEAIRRGKSQVQTASDSLGQAELARDALFAEAGARDEEAFRQRLGVFRERTRLLSVIRDARSELTAVLGLGDEARAVEEQLASGELSKWQEALDRVDSETEEVRPKRDDALVEEGQARAEREAIEQSTDIAAIALQREGLLKELSDRVHEWQALGLAKGLIERTLEAFVRDRQPQVLAQAAPHLATITEGRYERVLQAQDAHDILVMDSGGGTRGVADLSRGTAEQLYLCIRLALADEFSRAGADLPVIMDEVLVNFDPARARLAARILVDFAGGHQVIVFTCHPETRDSFVAIDPSVRVLEVGPVEPIAAPTEPEVIQATLLSLESVGEEVSTTVSAELTQRILEMLTERSLALGELVERTGFAEEEVRKALAALRRFGKVDVTGHARGARWQLCRDDEQGNPRD